MSNTLQAAFELLKTFCMSHGVELLFTKTSAYSFVIGLIGCYVTIGRYGWGANGYFLSRAVMDTWNLCAAIYAFVTLDSPSKGLATKEETLEGMGTHLYDSMLFIGGSYSQFLGFEFTSLYIYHTADIS